LGIAGVGAAVIASLFSIVPYYCKQYKMTINDPQTEMMVTAAEAWGITAATALTVYLMPYSFLPFQVYVMATMFRPFSALPFIKL
jgi:hypothetical protein